jgi:transposase-like protein
LSEQRKYRSWTAQQKIEIVLARLRGKPLGEEVCRGHAISETLYHGWREMPLEGGREAVGCVNTISLQIAHFRTAEEFTHPTGRAGQP